MRCIFRCAELFGGFDSSLANNEVLFMLLDGTLMIIAALSLTIFHPGITLGENWHTATFNLRTKKAGAAAEKLFPASENSSQVELSSTEYSRLPLQQGNSEYARLSAQQDSRYEPYRNQEA